MKLEDKINMTPGAVNALPNGITPPAFLNQQPVSGAQLKSDLAAALKPVCDIISRAAAAGITLTFQLQTDPAGNSYISLLRATKEL